jgi:hypothetical protein
MADVLFNAHLTNTTGNVADDYHVKMTASQNINITSTFEAGGDVMFPDALGGGGVQGNGTTSVTINWTGATVNQNQTAHFGAGSGVGGGTPNGFQITESWWTFGGAKLVPADSASGRLCSANFNGVAGSGDWVVVKIELFDSPTSSTPIGTEWIEGRGTSAHIINWTSDGPIFARWAFNTPSATQIPIADLNPSLTGFGDFGPMVVLEPIEVAPSLTPYGLLVLLLLLIGVTVWILRKRAFRLAA